MLLEDQLCGEMGRYGDVRVVRRSESRPARPCPAQARRLGLSARVFVDRSGRAGQHTRLLDSRNANQIRTKTGGRQSQSKAFYEETARKIAARVASEHGVVAKQLWVEERQRPLAELLSTTEVILPVPISSSSTASPRNSLHARSAAAGRPPSSRNARSPGCSFARLYIANYAFEDGPPLETPIEDAVAFAQSAVHLDPSSQRARAALAAAFLFKDGLRRRPRRSGEGLRAGIPGCSVYLEWIGWLLALLGDWQRGAALIRRSIARNPSHIPVALHALWADHLRRGKLGVSGGAALPGCHVLLAGADASVLPWPPGRVAEAKHAAAELGPPEA